MARRVNSARTVGTMTATGVPAAISGFSTATWGGGVANPTRLSRLRRDALGQVGGVAADAELAVIAVAPPEQVPGVVERGRRAVTDREPGHPVARERDGPGP